MGSGATMSRFPKNASSSARGKLDETNNAFNPAHQESLTSFANDRYHAAYTFALRLTGSREDAEELVQDAFTHLLRHWPTIAPEARWTYFRKIIQYRYIDARRRYTPTLVGDPALLDRASQGSIEEQVVLHYTLDSALAALPVILRRPIVLVDAMGYSTSEAARELGISLSAAKERISRGRSMLRIQFDADRVDWARSRGRLSDDGVVGEAMESNVGAVGAAVTILRERGDSNGLRALADDGHPAASKNLAQLLRERGDTAELSRRADRDEPHYGYELDRLLRDNNDIDGLRRRADAGSKSAAQHLAALLRGRGFLDELAQRANDGDSHASRALARHFRETRDIDSLRTWADSGDESASHHLAQLLLERDEVDELRRRAEAGQPAMTESLSRLAYEKGALDELRELATHGSSVAAAQLAHLLRLTGAIEELRYRAAEGDSAAMSELAVILRDRGDEAALEELDNWS